MDITIDGQTIRLTPLQAEQFKKAVLKETETPLPLMLGGLKLSCKKTGKSSSYPFVLSSSAKVQEDWGVGLNQQGKDFSLAELKTFIQQLKVYAAKIWPTAPQVLKNV